MRAVPVRFYTQVSALEPVAWTWVEEQLRSAAVYWVIARSDGRPHPRPVWGVWLDDAVWLSIGSPALNEAAHAGEAFTVHLESGTEPVIVEGSVDDSDREQSEAIAAYDAKYDWTYDVAEYGALIRIAPIVVIAWQTKGYAGRESFQAVGKWVAESEPDRLN